MSMIRPKITGFLALLLAMTAGLLWAAEKAKPSIAISISAPKDVVGAGAQTRIDITITNISDSAVALPYDSSGKADLSGFRFDVTRGDGKQPKIMKYYWEKTGRKASKENVKDINREYIVVSNVVSLPLQPKETVKYYAVMNDLYDLSVPGQYTINVNGTDPVTNAVVKSNEVAVTVTK
jgi:hypothetical protein